MMNLCASILFAIACLIQGGVYLSTSNDHHQPMDYLPTNLNKLPYDQSVDIYSVSCNETRQIRPMILSTMRNILRIQLPLLTINATCHPFGPLLIQFTVPYTNINLIQPSAVISAENMSSRSIFNTLSKMIQTEYRYETAFTMILDDEFLNQVSTPKLPHVWSLRIKNMFVIVES